MEDDEELKAIGKKKRERERDRLDFILSSLKNKNK
jgi:hypothetical protein